MLNCQEAARLSSESHDRSLTLSERVLLRFHLFRCKLCSRYLRQLKFLQGACTRIDEDPGHDAKISVDARERIRERLNRG